MTAHSRFVVPGEDLPSFVASAFAAIGVATTVGALLTWASAARADHPRPAAPAVAVVVAPAPAPAPTLAPVPSAPPPVASAPERPRCPALVVNFRAARVAPPAAAQGSLSALAAWLVAHPTTGVFVDGHADSTGSDDGNLRLSRHRAALVRAALVRSGASPARITIRGFGSYWPVGESPPDASWNRRVVIQTHGDECPREREEVIDP
jgi:outer membrane protein OmpA-like peptidoglycan-associated protein